MSIKIVSDSSSNIFTFPGVSFASVALKINTVVSKLNLQENLLPLYRACRPQRIKLLKMHLITLQPV